MMAILQQLAASRMALLASLGTLTGLLASWWSRLIPGWFFFAVIVAIVLGIAAFVYGRRWWARRKDRELEEALDGQSATQLGQRRVRDREAVKELQKKWKESVEQLRKSKVGRQRQWLYFLPWYVIIGAPAGGKTTAIQKSGLTLHNRDRLQGTGGTRNCDWWFADEAIILDTAGRWLFGESGEPDQDEWLTFLQLLKKYRPAVPINGLILAVSAQDLLGKEPDQVEEDAERARGKIDQVIRELGIQFPVYLLVTKCDLIEGFTEFFGGPAMERRRNEMLGWTNPSFDMKDPRRIVQDALRSIRERAAALRPDLLKDEDNPKRLRGIFLFTEELRGLEELLERFCEVVFRETQYHEAPFLRGIYLTSSIQQGTTMSRMLERLLPGLKSTELGGQQRSYFLRDFFKQQLPADRNLVATTGHARGKTRVVHNLVLAGVVAACILAAVVTSGSYVANRTLLNQLQDSVDQVAGVAGGPRERMHGLGQYVETLERLEVRNKNRPLSSGWGLYTGYRAIEPARDLFLRRFAREGYGASIDPARVAVESVDPVREFAGMEAIVRNYVLSTTLNGSTVPAPGANEALAFFWSGGEAVEADVAESFQDAYHYYLRWRPTGDAIGEHEAHLALLRRTIPERLTVDRVAAWMDRQMPAFTSADVSDAATKVAPQGRVRSVFRPEAWRDRVSPLLDAVDLVSQDVDQEITKRFRLEYGTRFWEEWRQFLMAARERPTSPVGATVLLGEKTPYLALVDRTADASEVELGEGEEPAWVPVVRGIHKGREEYLAQLATIRHRLAGGAQDPPAALEDAKSIFSRPLALDGGDAEPPPDPFGRAEHFVRKLVNEPFKEDLQSESFRRSMTRLLTVPVEMGFATYLDTVEEWIDREWQELIANNAGNRGCQLFARPGGQAWEFFEQYLAGFVERPRLSGKERYGSTLGIDARFFNTMGQRCAGGGGGGGPSPGRPLMVESRPTIEPAGVPVTVTRTVLEVYCDGEPWRLEHQQFRVERSFPQWSEDRCGPATISLYGGEFGSDKISSLESDTLLQLLKKATRDGVEYRWQMDGGATAVFVVLNLPTSPDVPARLPRAS